MTYSQLAYLSAVAEQGDPGIARTALYELFRTVEALNPSKDAVSYWQAVNRAMLRTTAGFESLWALEKVAAAEAIEIGKFESLTYLSKMRAKMMLLSREEAVKELLRLYRVESRVDTIASIANSKILDIE